MSSKKKGGKAEVTDSGAAGAAASAAATGDGAPALAPGKVSVRIVAARNLIPMDSNKKSDPFAVVTLNKDKKTKETTKTVKKTLNPVWDETFEFHSAEPLTDRLSVAVWDYDKWTSNDFEGHMSVPVMACAAAEKFTLDQWFPLLDKGTESKAKSKKERGEIHLVLTFIPGDKSKRRHLEKDPATGDDRVVAVLPDDASARWAIDFDTLVCGKELGRGAFGVVYKGKWRLQDVAIKQLHQQSMTADQLQEFRDECNLMMGLRPHRNIVPLLGVCLDPAKPFCLVIDFVDAGTLEKLIQTPGFVFGWQVVFGIAKGVCAGMHHLHQERILHRDLAARNVLLRGNYEPLIADFGLSKKVDMSVAAAGGKAPSRNPTADNVATQEDEALRGPYKWMAPESLSRNEFSVKSDTWSYGVTLWETISRSPQGPFPHLDIYQAADQIVNHKLRLAIPPGTPTKLAGVIASCWHTDPADRPDFVQIGLMLTDMEDEASRW